MKNYKARLKNITTIVMDFDGVLSDGSIWVLPDGEALRMGNVKDGYIIQLAVKLGFKIAIISGGYSESMQNRSKMLNIDNVYLKVRDKLKQYNEFIEQNNINSENVLYVGDDLPDYQVMKEVSIAVCPADAAEEIKSIAHYISPRKGGKGCVRDIIEQVLKAQGKWMIDDCFRW